MSNRAKLDIYQIPAKELQIINQISTRHLPDRYLLDSPQISIRYLLATCQISARYLPDIYRYLLIAIRWLAGICWISTRHLLDMYQILDTYQTCIRYLLDRLDIYLVSTGYRPDIYRYLPDIYQVPIRYLRDIYQTSTRYLLDISQIVTGFLLDSSQVLISIYYISNRLDVCQVSARYLQIPIGDLIGASSRYPIDLHQYIFIPYLQDIYQISAGYLLDISEKSPGYLLYIYKISIQCTRQLLDIYKVSTDISQMSTRNLVPTGNLAGTCYILLVPTQLSIRYKLHIKHLVGMLDIYQIPARCHLYLLDIYQICTDINYASGRHLLDICRYLLDIHQVSNRYLSDICQIPAGYKLDINWIYTRYLLDINWISPRYLLDIY